MKVIHIPNPPPQVCDCWPKVDAYYRSQGADWPVGTRIECDCGKRFELHRHGEPGEPPSWVCRPTRVGALV